MMSRLGPSRPGEQAGCSATKSPQKYVYPHSYPSIAFLTLQFNHVNGLQLVARAHQLVNEGYKFHFKDRAIVTCWSAPNYCGRCGNVASIMSLGEDLDPKFSIFSAVPEHRRAAPQGRGTRAEYFL